MLLGCIADDFTGASDLANTLNRGGMRTTQFIGIPSDDAAPSCEAGVVALKTRSIAAADAVAQSLAALDWLRRQGCRQFLFKYCSTFDSTPEGNIGPIGSALAQALGVKGVVVCPCFPSTGRRVFQGHLFVQDRLLSESGMQNHPLTPMSDSDLRRWLGRQVDGPVGLVPHQTVRQGAAAIKAALADWAGQAELVIVDAIEDEDLIRIGEAVAEAPLVTGGSGIALGLPANFARLGLLAGSGGGFRGVAGHAIVLAGSCSTATREQVAVHAGRHPAFSLDIAAVMAGSLDAGAVAAFLLEHRDELPLAYSTADADSVRGVQGQFGREAVAERVERLFGEVAVRLVEAGIPKLIVAGGETSGAIVSALGLRHLEIGPEIAPGVPALVASGERRIGLALKSGNFGDRDFFETAARTLEPDHGA